MEHPASYRDTKDAKDSAISPAAPQRTPSSSSLHKSGHSHRSSFAENLRGLPPSPRAQRHPSFTQSAIQDLLNNPPNQKHHNPRFAGRDWRDVAIGELVAKDDVKWVEMDTSVEDASMALVKHTSSNVVLIREDATSTKPVSTFDYSDLNAYILVVVGLAHPSEDLVELYDVLAKKAQDRVSIPLRDIQPICRKESLVTLPGDQNLFSAIEAFGSGIHRILVTNHSGEVVGILSQLKLMEFFWNEGGHFRAVDELYSCTMRELGVGSQQIIAVNADSPLTEALNLMSQEGLTSVAVVDNGLNVVGNISTADVKLLTSSTSLPLLQNTCMHFISVILTERGTENGKDSFPVFYVNPYSTLAHTVAKLVATRSHRMWVVESASPSPSAPSTPSLGPTVFMPNTPSAAQSSTGPHFPSVPASSLSGSHLSGRLSGVVTLTDILNLFAKSTGLNPSDPNEQRARRRRSSSSSLRPSLDSSRASIDIRR
ncbi:Uu.00g138690.m01.CDS01 [Anthostomella pinea]|uniref:Protein SDS23 n=1 Tax=Anthostomella pinea TaxID=933095 RepID=A0AAI8VPR3_9PEZI|nr:Uu.00g138690.m01.CDS01 [Anthostomella pinea]